ncbi:BMP family ABC transporter substrate-binding protein [Streptomyces sp. NPDC046197]|uniref:BMP family ABC transporter substrate-binding protein n=1 Tax=Streptomyces sp. NPDC046197 TaxID=3154337 RepID=UPI0033E72DE1
MLRIRGRARWITGSAAVLVVAAGAVAFWPGGGSDAPQVRARQYTSSQACLLTDDRGIAGRQAAAVWAGMEDASLATHGKVSYLQVTGPATVPNAIPYANSLLQRHCDMVLGVGAAQAGAVVQVAQKASRARFVVVGGGGGPTRPNVTTVGLSAGTRKEVAHVVEAALHR